MPRKLDKVAEELRAEVAVRCEAVILKNDIILFGRSIPANKLAIELGGAWEFPNYSMCCNTSTLIIEHFLANGDANGASSSLGAACVRFCDRK